MESFSSDGDEVYTGNEDGIDSHNNGLSAECVCMQAGTS